MFHYRDDVSSFPFFSIYFTHTQKKKYINKQKKEQEKWIQFISRIRPKFFLRPDEYRSTKNKQAAYKQEEVFIRSVCEEMFVSFLFAHALAPREKTDCPWERWARDHRKTERIPLFAIEARIITLHCKYVLSKQICHLRVSCRHALLLLSSRPFSHLHVVATKRTIVFKPSGRCSIDLVRNLPLFADMQKSWNFNIIPYPWFSFYRLYHRAELNDRAR